MIMSRQFL